MPSLSRRVDALLDCRRERDLLIHIGPSRPPSTPPGLRETADVGLPDGTRLRVFSGAAAPLAAAGSGEDRGRAWILGSAFHPDVPPRAMAKWMLDRVLAGDFGVFGKVEGLYTAFVLDERGGVLHLVTDALGLRPVFLRREGADTWIANRVGTRWDREALPAPIDMEALRCWAYFGYNATDRALLQGWRRPPGATRVSITRAEISQARYQEFDLTPHATDTQRAYERIFDCLQESVTLQTRGSEPLKIALSGGFDSRVLAAMASPELGSRLQAIVVDGSDSYRDRRGKQSTESLVARDICDRLRMPLQVIRLDGEPLQAYGEPFTLRADGFPITKQIIMLTIREGDSTSVMDGFLGDNLAAGLWDRIEGRTESELEGRDLTGLLLQRHGQLSSRLLKPELGRSLTEWAREFMNAMTAPYREQKRSLIGASTFMHNRFYMSNNFLQHLHLCEPILPYASAGLTSLKLAMPDGTQSLAAFREAIGRRFPAIADIPHTKDLARPPARLRLTSRIKRSWSLAALLALREGDALAPFDRKVLAPRLAVAALDSRLEYVASMAMRFLVLETLVSRLGLDIDWERG